MLKTFRNLFVKSMTVPAKQAVQIMRNERTLLSCGLWAPFTIQNVLVFKVYNLLDPQFSEALQDISEAVAKDMEESFLL